MGNRSGRHARRPHRRGGSWQGPALAVCSIAIAMDDERKHRRPCPRALAGVGALLLLAPAAASGDAVAGAAVAGAGHIAGVWAVDDGTKITADQVDHSLAAGNGIFSPAPPLVRLFGLRNETVAFQVILTGGDEDTAGVTVTLDAVGPIINRDATGDADGYFVDRHIEVFAQHYVHVGARSHDLAWRAGSDAEPAGPTGWVPDALLPHGPHGPHGPQRSITVPAGQNRGLWIDIQVPRDAPAGVHRGTVIVAVDGVPCALPACRLPVELEVLPLALPDEPAVATMLWASAVGDEPGRVMRRYFPDIERIPAHALRALRARHFALARRYRVTLVAGVGDRPTDELRARLTGEAFTRAAGYTGPGEGVGQDLCPIHMYGGRLAPAEAALWSDWLTTHAPAVERFLYVYDEPGDEALFPTLNEVARAARPIPSFVTSPYDVRLKMDIFATPTEYYARATAAEAAARGKRVWIYNGIRPYSGSFVIDDVAISPRVNPWIQYKYGVPRWFYWEATYYEDFQGERGHIDVFSEAVNFSNRHGDRVNGDGLLMYPGRDLLFPAQDRGIDGPLPSIRLANWRRGIEDAGYLALARQAGHDALVDALLDVMVPRALAHGVRPDDPVAWPEDGERWLAARRTLFDALKTGQAARLDEDVLGKPPESFRTRIWRRIRRWLAPFARSPRRIAATTCAALLGAGIVAWMWLRRRRMQRQS